MAGDHIEQEGTVLETYAGDKFKVELKTTDNKTIVATLSGKMRNKKIRIIVGDNVKVRFSPYDTNTGQITWRNR